MKYIKVNLNDLIKFKPTEKGIKLLNMYHKRELDMFMCLYGKNQTKVMEKLARDYTPQDGELQFQLHHFIQVFGDFNEKKDLDEYVDMNVEILAAQPGPAASLDSSIIHGFDCEKHSHETGHHEHDENDDKPYNVDGCWYCGRCHHCL